MNLIRLRMKSYIQPFERRLALQELRIMASAEPKRLGLLEETSTEYQLKSRCSSAELANRLAYWETVEVGDRALVTMQSLRESTVNSAKNGIAFDVLRERLPFRGEVPLPNRRCLRYGTHGIHEYRGKFFPQLVRSLINVSGIAKGGIVADPMSGSGTTVAEATLAGSRGFGIDMNPLSVFIGQMKCRLLHANPSKLVAGYEKLHRRLNRPGRTKSNRFAYLRSLPKPDQQYLSSWFSKHALAELDDISQAIAVVDDPDTRDLMRIALSNILRSVSWQKDDDLRVRKEIFPDAEIDPKKEFLEELERSTRAVLAFLYQNGSAGKGMFKITQGDARKCSNAWGEKSIDAVITSPPYATALPYLDTDRLSLCYLGMLQRPEHRAHDQKMIGNREITERLRQSYWSRLASNTDPLPITITKLIRHINTLNSKIDVGFRRRNLPALLAKYFFDMSDVMKGIHRVLKPRSLAFVVVGNNHTIAGGRHVDIPTASLLQDIARDVGFHVTESMPMEMLVSRDIFKKNATASEEILTLYKPA